MPDRTPTGIIYYRNKSDACGGLVVGCLLLGIAAVVLTQDSVMGFGFSQDLIMLCTYWALPIGAILLLVNIRHAVARGPTMVAAKAGITVLFTPEPFGPLQWGEITGFSSFQHQGKWFLGITFEDPLRTLTPVKERAEPLLKKIGPKTAHLSIPGKMMDEYIAMIETELDEMRQVHSWRT
jgi:hypothetical protein